MSFQSTHMSRNAVSGNVGGPLSDFSSATPKVGSSAKSSLAGPSGFNQPPTGALEAIHLNRILARRYQKGTASVAPPVKSVARAHQQRNAAKQLMPPPPSNPVTPLY